MNELVAGFRPNAFDLCTEADIAFSTLIKDTAACQNLGSVRGTNKLRNPSQCFIDLESSGPVAVGEMAMNGNFAKLPYYYSSCASERLLLQSV